MIQRFVLGALLLIAMGFCAFYTITQAGAAQGPKQGLAVVDKDSGDKITETEALRFENKYLKLQQIQAACESQPQYVQARAALVAEGDAIATAHHMDAKAGDNFDVATRQITRKSQAKAAAVPTPEKKG